MKARTSYGGGGGFELLISEDRRRIEEDRNLMAWSLGSGCSSSSTTYDRSFFNALFSVVICG